MTLTCNLRSSLIGTTFGWIAAFGVWIVLDMIQPPPPDDRLDCLVMDIFLCIAASPITIPIWLGLSGLNLVSPSQTHLWLAPIWILCGGFIGFGTTTLFFHALLPFVPHLREAALPLSWFNWGSLAGALSFLIAFGLRCRKTAVI